MIGDDERAAADRVLRSGSMTQGPEVAAFEDEFSTRIADRHCVAMNSGTSSLHISLLALGIGPGDEVIVPSFTFAATANAVRLAGAVPVFVDICPDTFCIDPGALSSAITTRTAAVIPVHLFGHPADFSEIATVAGRHSLALIEDAAQAHAASVDGLPVGSLGDAAAFSFYPTKNMTTGEGGIAAFADATAARIARLLRNQGMERPYENETIGFNLRMTEISAAIGRVQLRRLDGFTAARRRHATMLNDGLKSLDVVTPVERPNSRHVFHQYTIRTTRRAELMASLNERAVESRVFYPVPVHRLPPFDRAIDLPETALAAQQVLSLPVGPHLDDEDILRVIEAVTG